MLVLVKKATIELRTLVTKETRRMGPTVESNFSVNSLSRTPWFRRLFICCAQALKEQHFQTERSLARSLYYPVSFR
jgi:hypothetical protein